MNSSQMRIYDYRSSQIIAVNDQAYNICYTLCKAAYYNDYLIISAVPENKRFHVQSHISFPFRSLIGTRYFLYDCTCGDLMLERITLIISLVSSDTSR